MTNTRRSSQDDIDRRAERLLNELTADNPSLLQAIEEKARARVALRLLHRTAVSTPEVSTPAGTVIVAPDAIPDFGDELTDSIANGLESQDEVEEKFLHLRPHQLVELSAGHRDATSDETEHLAKCRSCTDWLDQYQVALAGGPKIREEEKEYLWPFDDSPQPLPVHRLRDGVCNGITARLDGVSAVLNALPDRDRLPSEVLHRLAGYLSGLREIAEGLERGPLFEPIVRRKLGPTGGNRILEATVAWATEAAHAAGRYAYRQLQDQLGEIADKWETLSASLWKVEERSDPNDSDRVKRYVVPFVVSNNQRSDNTRKNGYPVPDGTPIDRCGFIALAAAGTGRVVNVADVEQDKVFARYFRNGVIGTRSEIAVPLYLDDPLCPEWQAEVQRPVGVLDLQFDRILNSDKLHSRADEVLRDTLSLVPDLVVLDALRRGGEDWCPWHPNILHWKGEKLLEQLCHEVCDALGHGRVSLSVWLANQRDRCLSVFATAAFHYGFCAENELPVFTAPDNSEPNRIRWSWTGRVLSSQEQLLSTNRPKDEFLFNEKAKAMKLQEAFGTVIPRGSVAKSVSRFLASDLTELPTDRSSAEKLMDHAVQDRFGTLNLYFKGDSGPSDTERDLVREALPRLARFIGGWLTAYDRQRQRFAWALVQLKLDEPPETENSTRTRLSKVRYLIREMFGGDVATSFFCRSGDYLFCASTDGLYRPQPPKQRLAPRFTASSRRDPPFDQDEWGPLCYQLSNPTKGRTVDLFLNAVNAEFRATREKVNDSSQDRGSSLATDSSNPTPHLREHFGVTGDYVRWFLAAPVSIQGKDEALGVIRVVRPSGGRPFTEFDEGLLESIASACSSLFELWHREMQDYLNSKEEECGQDDQQVQWLKDAGVERPLRSKKGDPVEPNTAVSKEKRAVGVENLSSQQQADEQLDNRQELLTSLDSAKLKDRREVFYRQKVSTGYFPSSPSGARPQTDQSFGKTE